MNPRNRTIQSLERAMALLELLKHHPQGARLSELCSASGLSTSTAHGLLDTLLELGYVSQHGTLYQTGARTRSLAQAGSQPAQQLRELFTPALKAFNELCGHTCVLAVPAGTRAYLTLDSLDAQGRSLDWGDDEQRDGLTTSAVGKVFLAHDPSLNRRVRRRTGADQALEQELLQIARQGFALDLQASRQGLNCMALPLRLRGKLVAALGTSAPAEHLGQPLMRRLARRAMRDLFDLVKC